MLDDAGDAVVIGQGEGLQTELNGGRGQLIGLVGPVEEGVGGVGVELGITVTSGHVLVAPGALEGWGLVDEGCELEGVGCLWVGGGLKGSGFLAGLGAAGL